MVVAELVLQFGNGAPEHGLGLFPSPCFAQDDAAFDGRGEQVVPYFGFGLQVAFQFLHHRIGGVEPVKGSQGQGNVAIDFGPCRCRERDAMFALALLGHQRERQSVLETPLAQFDPSEDLKSFSVEEVVKALG